MSPILRADWDTLAAKVFPASRYAAFDFQVSVELVLVSDERFYPCLDAGPLWAPNGASKVYQLPTGNLGPVYFDEVRIAPAAGLTNDDVVLVYRKYRQMRVPMWFPDEVPYNLGWMIKAHPNVFAFRSEVFTLGAG